MYTPLDRHSSVDTPFWAGSDLWADTPTGQTPPRADTPQTPQADTPLLGRHPPPSHGHCSEWYTSYWNTFLLIIFFNFFPVDISFNVQLSGRLLFNGTEKIIFDDVISNIGNGYNSTSGISTVPPNGTYTLMLITNSIGSKHYAFITVNDKRLSLTYAGRSYRTGKLSIYTLQCRFCQMSFH